MWSLSQIYKGTNRQFLGMCKCNGHMKNGVLVRSLQVMYTTMNGRNSVGFQILQMALVKIV